MRDMKQIKTPKTKNHLPIISILFHGYRWLTERSKCTVLRKELINLVRGSHDIAERLVNSEKHKNPGKPENWYLEKVIYDLKRGR
jgi:hypothetical protein